MIRKLSEDTERTDRMRRSKRANKTARKSSRKRLNSGKKRRYKAVLYRQ